MLFLIFSVDQNNYAIPAREVVEVTPLVSLHSISSAPEYISGIMNYRTEKIPVLDLCALLKKSKYRKMMTTRIIVHMYRAKDYTGLIGLIAEHVTELVDLEEDAFDLTGINTPDAPYLAGVATHDKRMIQRIHPDKLLHKKDCLLISMQEGVA